MIEGPQGGGLPIGANPSFYELVKGQGASLPVLTGGSEATAPVTPHGTTVLALKYADGVIMAGDRRAVEGYTIADNEMTKVFAADEHSAVGIAGVAGQALEMVRLFQVELEHYEKVEGEHLSLEGKANRLAQMLRGSFPMVMQGIVVVPVYAGYDLKRSEGRIFRYDVIGGRYEEGDYAATGSGSMHAKASMKKRWRPRLERQRAVEVAVEGLIDAGESDTATAGPDLIRGIYPTLHLVTADGVDAAPEAEVKAAAEAVIARRGPGS